MNQPRIIEVDAGNVEEYGFFCIKNKKHPGYRAKADWLGQRFSEGLKIQLLASDQLKPLGFIEYTPSEAAWRGIRLEGYLFIHCLYLGRKADREQGWGSRLIQKCIDDARAQHKKGVAVLSGDAGWLADRSIFLKNGFVLADEKPPAYQLMVYPLTDDPLPRFPQNDQPPRRKGFHLLYANQCPFHQQSAEAILNVAADHGYEVQVTELTTAEAAQQAPSPYGVFNLLYDGRLVAEHYISATRFRNILKKELQL